MPTKTQRTTNGNNGNEPARPRGESGEGRAPQPRLKHGSSPARPVRPMRTPPTSTACYASSKTKSSPGTRSSSCSSGRWPTPDGVCSVWCVGAIWVLSCTGRAASTRLSIPGPRAAATGATCYFSASEAPNGPRPYATWLTTHGKPSRASPEPRRLSSSCAAKAAALSSGSEGLGNGNDRLVLLGQLW